MADWKTLIGKLKQFYKDIRLNRSIVTYLICVIIASILWFLSALNQDYSTELTYPIKYVHLPEDKYLICELPSELQLEVQAKGFTLVGNRVKTSFLPINFNFAPFAELLQEKRGIFEYTLNTADIKDRIAGQISPDIKLLSIYPEKLVFQFAATKEKKIAVRPMLDYTLKKQYILNQVTAVPDSVIVRGASNIIDTLQYASTAIWSLKNANKTQQKVLKLQEIANCQLVDKSVEVTLEIEQFTEARRSILIQAKQVPDSINVRLFPASVDITYDVGLSKYNSLNDKDFIFSVDYPVDPTAPYLKVKAEKIPAFIKNLDFSPQKVEYILEKK